MVLGIAWGTTLAAIGRRLTPKPTRNSAVVQLNGAANTRTSGIEYASDLITGSARRSTRRCTTSRCRRSSTTRRPRPRCGVSAASSACSTCNDVQTSRCSASGAVTGGLPSHVYSAGYLEPADVDLLHREGVVGDVCTVFLRADGSLRGHLAQRAGHRARPRQSCGGSVGGCAPWPVTRRSRRCGPRSPPGW